MKLNEAFPSNFLKAEDLAGRTVPCTIAAAEMEELGQGRDKETKLVLSFAGKEKKLVCNKTNASAIAKLHGDDTDLWIGKVINLVPREVEYQGDTVWAIRIATPAPGTTAARKPAPKPVSKAEPSDNDGVLPEEADPFA